MRPSARGFTLLEVLVALAIVAIGLTAALRATGVGADGVGAYRERLLAHWLAENVASEHYARRYWPAPGERGYEQELAGRRFQLKETVQTTPNPGFRRLDLRVARADAPAHELRRLVVFLPAP